MSVTIGELRPLIREFRFQDVFIGLLGWSHSTRARLCKEVRGSTHTLTPIAESGGFVVLEVTSPDGRIPDSSVRKAIHSAVTPDFHEHLLIFLDGDRSAAVFQFSKRAKDKTVIRERRFAPGMPVAPLLECLSELEIPFQFLDEEGKVPITLVKDIVERSGAFAERVTRRFYDEFRRRREAFEPFLQWIEDQSKRDWYISALLNRLMFIFFIQEKGFLPDGRDFLRRRLEESKQAGTDLFYREYLLPLFFFGFGKRQGERGRFEQQFRNILFLDGGLFNVHSVEAEYGINHDTVAAGTLPTTAVIPDAEFERWFDYFYRWRWILEEELEEHEGHISPAILGYIFEKYVNQKQMGAYYTKEDITGYICRNTIIPRLFDMLAECSEKGKKAVEPLPIGPHPNLLNNGLGISYGEGIDRYVYPAVKSVEYLPTETDYEYNHRQKRYESILQDYDDGKITTVNDFITYNLDIVRMAQDFVSCIQDAEVLHDFYFRCLKRVSVLDPTCGSGAFLFAALNILYPLYEACLVKMGELLEGEPGSAVAKGHAVRKVEPGEAVIGIERGAATEEMMQRFREELRKLAEHPDRDYFLNKSIIVNNLFGVDILEEAVEICKLRLFLTLIAKVEPDASLPNLGVEPLPDIDFNILAGNTLVGYTSIEDIDRLWEIAEQEAAKSKDGSVSFQRVMPFEKDHSRLRDLCREYGEMLQTYRLQQLGERHGAPVSKEQVEQAAEQVRPELNKDLWRLYRQARLWPNPHAPKGSPDTFEHFLRTHQPFHWFLEFPSIAASGGFDVIVGNPPYCNYIRPDRTGGVALRSIYSLIGYRTLSTNDLYAFVLEVCTRIRAPFGRFSMIVALSVTFSRYFAPLRDLLLEAYGSLWHTSYDNIPGRMFTGDKQSDNTSTANQQRTTILIASGRGPAMEVHGSWLHRWRTDERPIVFQLLAFSPNLVAAGIWPWAKVKSAEEVALLSTMANANRTIDHLLDPEGHHLVVVPKTAGYYVSAYEAALDRTKQGEWRVATSSDLDLLLLLVNSNVMFWWWRAFGDGFDVTREVIGSFPVPCIPKDQLTVLASEIRAAISRCTVYKGYRGVQVPNVNLNKELELLREVDQAILKGFGAEDIDPGFLVLSKSNSFIGLDVPRS